MFLVIHASPLTIKEQWVSEEVKKQHLIAYCVIEILSKNEIKKLVFYNIFSLNISPIYITSEGNLFS